MFSGGIERECGMKWVNPLTSGVYKLVKHTLKIL